MGLEPILSLEKMILSHLRLPIPPEVFITVSFIYRKRLVSVARTPSICQLRKRRSSMVAQPLQKIFLFNSILKRRKERCLLPTVTVASPQRYSLICTVIDSVKISSGRVFCQNAQNSCLCFQLKYLYMSRMTYYYLFMLCV